MLQERSAQLVPGRQGIGQLVHEGGAPQPGRLRASIVECGVEVVSVGCFVGPTTLHG
jgi:hypothetical protein